MGGPGGSGTVTAIDKTSSPQTLTLRTETGTETVDISSTTTFTKEMQTIDLNAIALNDVVRVVPVRPTSGSAPSGTTPVTPGTGTVAASRVIVVEPMIDIGTWREKMWGNGWTAVTADGSRTAQFEQTLVVTDTGVEVLTPEAAA